MDIGFALIVAFAFGVAVGWGIRSMKRKEFTLLMSIQLDATTPVAIKAVGKDAEGNTIDLTGTDLTIEAIPIEGDFGTVNDEQDTFNPGAAGATGTIKGSVTVNDVEYVAEVEVELVPGGLTEIGLEFAPA